MATPLQVYKQFTFSGMKNEVLIRVNDPDGDTYSSRADELLYEGISALALSDYSRDGYTGLVRTESIDPNKLSSAYRIQVNGAARDIQLNVTSTDYAFIGITDVKVTRETLMRQTSFIRKKLNSFTAKERSYQSNK